MLGRRWPAPLTWVVVYLAVGITGALLQPELGQEPWYPAAAIGVGLLVIRGIRWWPVVLLCDVVVSLVQYREVVGGFVSGTCTAVEIVLVAYLLRRLRFRPTFERPDDMVRLWFAGLVGALLAASAGSGLLRWLDATDRDYWRTWLVWFVGDSTGVLLVGPIVLLLAQPHWLQQLRALRGPRAAEVRFVIAASYALVIGYFAVTRVHEFEVGQAAPFTLCLTPLLWVAVRGGMLRTTMVVGTFDFIALASYQLFAHGARGGARPDNVDMVTMQMVVLSVGLASMGIAVSIDAAQRMHRQVTALVEASPFAILSADREGVLMSWNRAAERIFGYTAAEAVGGIPPILFDEESYHRRRTAAVVPQSQIVEYRHKDGRTVVSRLSATRNPTSEPGWTMMALIEDVTSEVAERSAQATLTAAVEQAGESIVVTTPEPAIFYANPAALASSGYMLEEVIGQNPRVFKSGRQDDAFYDRMWATLTAGEVWEGVLVNKRKDGSLYEERSTIAPVTDDNGKLIAYVAVKHDLSRERLLESDLARSLTIRGTALGVMAGVERKSSASETAAALCASIAAVSGLDSMVVALDSDGNMTTVGAAGAAMSPLIGQTLSAAHTELYREMIARGPFVGSAERQHEAASPWTIHLQQQGLTATMFTAICSDRRLVGMLILATTTHNGAEWMRENLALGQELGAFARVLIGAQIDNDLELARRRGELQAIIDHHRFPSCVPVLPRPVHARRAELRGADSLRRRRAPRPRVRGRLACGPWPRAGGRVCACCSRGGESSPRCAAAQPQLLTGGDHQRCRGGPRRRIGFAHRHRGHRTRPHRRLRRAAPSARSVQCEGLGR